MSVALVLFDEHTTICTLTWRVSK